MRQADRYPLASVQISGRRDRAVIPKENNFKQPGERSRSFDSARQERFTARVLDMLMDPG